MRVLKLLLILIVCTTAVSPAWAQADRWWGRYLPTWLGGDDSAGQLNDAKAAYDRGDYATALRLLRPLAEQGNARAQSTLGFMYANGRGVAKDDAAAVSWYRKAAEQGYVRAQLDLGGIYETQNDDVAAASWYRKAADQGLAFAQHDIGVMYAAGRGVAQDYVQAHMWFNLSAAQGNAGAVKNRNLIAAHMTPAQLAEAQRLASEWKPKPAR